MSSGIQKYYDTLREEEGEEQTRFLMGLDTAMVASAIHNIWEDVAQLQNDHTLSLTRVGWIRLERIQQTLRTLRP